MLLNDVDVNLLKSAIISGFYQSCVWEFNWSDESRMCIEIYLAECAEETIAELNYIIRAEGDNNPKIDVDNNQLSINVKSQEDGVEKIAHYSLHRIHVGPRPYTQKLRDENIARYNQDDVEDSDVFNVTYSCMLARFQQRKFSIENKVVVDYLLNPLVDHVFESKKDWLISNT